MDEATAILQRIADENKTRMPTEPMAAPLPPAAGEGHNAATQHMSLGKLFKDRHIFRRFIILSYVWCILCLVGTACSNITACHSDAEHNAFVGIDVCILSYVWCIVCW